MSRKSRQRAAYARRRAHAFEYLGGACAKCGDARTNWLEIDHVDPRAKAFTILGSKWSTAWPRWLEELEKCQLLCQDCHWTKTRADRAAKYLPHSIVEEPPF